MGQGFRGAIGVPHGDLSGPEVSEGAVWALQWMCQWGTPALPSSSPKLEGTGGVLGCSSPGYVGWPRLPCSTPGLAFVSRWWWMCTVWDKAGSECHCRKLRSCLQSGELTALLLAQLLNHRWDLQGAHSSTAIKSCLWIDPVGWDVGPWPGKLSILRKRPGRTGRRCDLYCCALFSLAHVMTITTQASSSSMTSNASS